ncbi:MAG: alanine--glyoxylate aminotransferase family protein [Desulfovibrio sp.]|jgi:aspartate aminotransferase-like enzyme|nr:alanine--glyoxylate aminotransferase family protein [Desulfovibrio sp.]
MLNKQRLLTPGPTPMPEQIRLAMAADMIHHRKAFFKEVMAETRAGLGELFGASLPVLPLSASGTGAMVAAVCTLFAPGEKVLVVEGGVFGERWTEICLAHKVVPLPLKVEWGQAVSIDAVSEALDRNTDIKGVLVQHSETSTGAMHPVKDLAALLRGREPLLVVDGISAVSVMPCPMDAWGIDCLLTGSQKGLMLPPGLALIALSERAWQKAESVADESYYFNLRKEREENDKQQTHFTSPVSLILALRESLRLLRSTGLANIYRKQWGLAQMARAGVTALGLQLFAPDSYAWGLTSILLPEGMDAGRILAEAADKYGVIMAAGQGGAFKSRMVRIGHMGYVDYADLAAGLHAFVRSFQICGGYLGCRNYLEQALDAYWTALEQGVPDKYL